MDILVYKINNNSNPTLFTKPIEQYSRDFD